MKGAVMADAARVNTGKLQAGSEHVFAAMSNASMNFAGHETELDSAAEGWVGASRQALGEVAQRWQAQHSAHQARVNRLGNGVVHAGRSYDGAEHTSSRALQT
jgi:uncharacterized protein YukE